MKKILITGANSYIGESVRDYLQAWPDNYSVDVIDTIGLDPSVPVFQGYDVVFNVAGIVHIKETPENRHLYYDINRDLIVKIANAAKAGGVKQFILLSTMSVYGITTGHITKETVPNPKTAYGKSKLEADLAIETLSDDSFAVACLRPPMVYGKGCKGNYQRLRQFALRFPFFPKYNNERSMVYIGNLCEFVKECIDSNKSGLFFPQNANYVNASELVKVIAAIHGKKKVMFPFFNGIIKLLPVDTVKKVFGNLTYETVDTINKYGFLESVKRTEE